MSLLDELTLDDLDPEQRELADCIGLAAYKKLVATYAGSSVYIRTQNDLARKMRNREIISEFNGYNFGELARKYRLTEQQIRNIVSEHIKRERNRPLENQLSLFNEDGNN